MVRRPREPRKPRQVTFTPRNVRYGKPNWARDLGTVYLLHFARPLHGIRHYVGWTTDLPKRIRRHAAAGGAAIPRLFAAAEIPFAIARLWPSETTLFERHIIRRIHKDPTAWCPICEHQYRLLEQWAYGRAEIAALGLTIDPNWLCQTRHGPQ